MTTIINKITAIPSPTVMVRRWRLAWTASPHISAYSAPASFAGGGLSWLT